jgi:hypothetical protein
MDKLSEFLSKKTLKKEIFYHSSFSKKPVFSKNNTFDTFDVKNNGAFHGAADKNIAETRVSKKILEDDRNGGYALKTLKRNPIMIVTEVSYSNALTLNENRTGQWNPHDVFREILNSILDGEVIHGITVDDLDEEVINVNGQLWTDLYNDSYGGEEYNQDYKEHLFVSDWLQSKGYDAIKYNNDFEGEGECIMTFIPENIKIIDSYCLKNILDTEFIKESPYQTGQEMTLNYRKSTDSASNYNTDGSDYGRDIEPTGDFINLTHNAPQNPTNIFTYGQITFTNPLLIEFKSTDSNGWKKDLSEMFDGKKGKALNRAIKQGGYDGVITVEKYKGKYYFNESVNISAIKIPNNSILNNTKKNSLNL